jgi:hypothetical protein
LFSLALQWPVDDRETLLVLREGENAGRRDGTLDKIDKRSGYSPRGESWCVANEGRKSADFTGSFEGSGT